MTSLWQDRLICSPAFNHCFLSAWGAVSLNKNIIIIPKPLKMQSKLQSSDQGFHQVTS